MKRKWAVFHMDLENKSTKSIMEKHILDNFGYRVRIFIPYVSILSKTKGKKDIYENEPMLFNYGFMKLPMRLIYDRVTLKRIAKSTPGMVSWLKSQTNMFQAKKRRRVDNAEDFDDFSLLAIVKDDEIRHMREIEKKNRIYSNDELSSISVGDYVILRGFPFEGLPATILSINYNKITIMVQTSSFNGGLTLLLPFENVLVSSYSYKEEIKEQLVSENIIEKL